MWVIGLITTPGLQDLSEIFVFDSAQDGTWSDLPLAAGATKVNCCAVVALRTCCAEALVFLCATDGVTTEEPPILAEALVFSLAALIEHTFLNCQVVISARHFPQHYGVLMLTAPWPFV